MTWVLGHICCWMGWDWVCHSMYTHTTRSRSGILSEWFINKLTYSVPYRVVEEKKHQDDHIALVLQSVNKPVHVYNNVNTGCRS
ncbi:hypothetical protein QR685DRAFT_24213 [Neurospora intermedia]|uniref:Secreted protein n=1 Tax=Neurospora intermedia TaxID=5142 RepID=A0ABR3DSH5_NEUIN